MQTTMGSIPGSRRFPGEENGPLLQYSCLENSMDRGACSGLQPMGLQRVGHDLAAKQQQTTKENFMYLLAISIDSSQKIVKYLLETWQTNS